jgi:plasmid maintenance system antidote protein VapI
MSESAAALAAVQTLLSAIRLASAISVDIQQLIAMQKQADLEGREISDAELQALITDARSAIDELRRGATDEQ